MIEKSEEQNSTERKEKEMTYKIRREENLTTGNTYWLK
jgi:hypothetical protein